MSTIEEKKAELAHMENRTQWRKAHIERIEALRNEVMEAEFRRPLKTDERKKNRVEHKH